MLGHLATSPLTHNSLTAGQCSSSRGPAGVSTETHDLCLGFTILGTDLALSRFPVTGTTET